MSKIPRDINSDELIKKLKMFDYCITRQIGSHIRLTSNHKHSPHNITIPNHKPLKIGTLASILKDIAIYLEIEKDVLIQELDL